MPARSTPLQAIVHLVRTQSAEPGVTVTESKIIRDLLGVDREVDIVVEGTFDGDSVMTSIEVIERGRRASVEWVEQEIAKHQYLPTNRLILISQAGFSKNALARVAAQGGRVEAIQPQFVMEDGQLKVETLYADMLQLRPTIGQMEVIHPSDGLPLKVDASTDIVVCRGEGTEIGNSYQLILEFLHIPWLIKNYLTQAHNHPEREQLGGFSAGVPIYSLGYHLRSEPDKTLHLILALYASGEVTYKQSPMPFTAQALGKREFGAGSGDLFGLAGVWVRSVEPSTEKETVSWRLKQDPSQPPLAADIGEYQFPELRDLPEPSEISPTPPVP